MSRYMITDDEHDKVICIGYFVAGYKKNNDVFLHWQYREKCPEVIKSRPIITDAQT